MLDKLKKAIEERSPVTRVASFASLVGLTVGWLTHADRVTVGVVFTLLALPYFWRWRTHVRYYLQDSRCTPALRRLVRLELALTAGWLIAGLVALYLQSNVLLFVACVAVAACMMVLAADVADALDETRMDSASRRVELSNFGQHMQLVLIRNGLSWCIRFFGNIFPTGRTSGFIATVLAILGLAILRMAGPAASDTMRFVRDALPKPAGSEKRPDAKKGEPPAATATPTATPTEDPPGTDDGPAEDPAPSLTYADLCGDEPTGEPAPPVQARALVDAFLAVGQAASGCARRPRPIRTREGHLTGAWTMEGRCATGLWSLTVVDAQGDAAILIGTQPARHARALARRGELLGASARIPVRSGDGYVLRTRRGNEILVRSQSSTHPARRVPPSCAAVPRTGVGYVSLPPRLAGLWLALARSDFAWPTEISPRRGARRFLFTSDVSPGRVVARGVCVGDRCTLERIGGEGIPRPAEVSAAVLALLTPSPAAGGPGSAAPAGRG